LVEFWPYLPRQPISEKLEWRTDVLPSAQAEQRLSLRRAPREMLTLSHVLAPATMIAAQELARRGAAGPWYVPHWPSAQTVTGLLSTDTTVAIDTNAADFSAQSVIALGVLGAEMRLVGVASVGPGTIVLAEPVGADIAVAVIAPVRVGVMTGGLQSTRRGGVAGEAQANFTLLGGSDIFASNYPQYLGIDVLTDRDLARVGLAEKIEQVVEYIDNGFGPIVTEPVFEYVQRRASLRAIDVSAGDRLRRRKWLHGLRGRQGAFWVPSWDNALTLQDGSQLASGSFVVPAVGRPEDYTGRHVMIEGSDGPFFVEMTGALSVPAGYELTFNPFKLFPASDCAIYIACDLSFSMEGSRLATQKAAVVALLGDLALTIDANAPNDLIVVGYGGQVSESMTRRNATISDHSDLASFADALVLTPSTSYEAGVSLAPSFFAGSGLKKRIMLFLSDGEASQSSLESALAVVAGVSDLEIYCFNIESGEIGRLIQLDNSPIDGVPVIASGNSNALRGALAAAIGGGVVVPSGTAAHWLTCMRLDSDVIETIHSGAFSETALPVVEVPA
jgi:hypothetical protein